MEMNLRKYLPIADLVPEAISTLSFKTDFVEALVLLVIYNKGRYEEILKTTNSDGVFSIQVRATEDDAADVESYWFNRYAGPFYFQVSEGGDIIPIAINFEGVVFEFKNVIGADSDYLIDITAGETVPPGDNLGLDSLTLNGTFILI